MKKNPKIVPLCDAVLFNDVEMFNRLINEGVDINERDYNNLTALWYASQECRYEMAKTLIEHGADIEVKDKIGNTPLFTAVYWYKKAANAGHAIAMNNLGIAIRDGKRQYQLPLFGFFGEKVKKQTDKGLFGRDNYVY